MRLFKTIDAYYIHRCIELARSGANAVNPDPLTGAIVLDKNRKKVSEAFRTQAGGTHAEIIALEQAGHQAKGGTLYVNSEFCCHTDKSSCIEAIIQAGITRVVFGTLLTGQGETRLQQADISVQHGFLEAECQKLNEIFFHYNNTQTPFVSLKLGMTMDGKIATRDGESKWLTGNLSRQYVHHLRSEHQVILTTSGTVLADDPQMTVRGVPDIARPPIRVILDRQCRLSPARYQIFNTETAPTWVFISKFHQHADYIEKVEACGGRVFEADDTGTGLDMQDVFRILGQNQISSVFVEAGGHLAGHLLNAHLIQKLYLFYAPRVLPDAKAVGGFSDSVSLNLEGAHTLNIARSYRIDKDWFFEAYPEQNR